jgi:CspA family cold shock protein
VLFGTIKYVSEKGYFFVEPDDGSADVFAHARGFQRAGIDSDTVKLGTRISFEAVPSRTRQGKFEATDIRLA